MSNENQQIVMVARPEGKLGPEHFELRESPVAAPGAGQVLVRSILLSIDAANRAWLDGPTYKDAVEPGDVMHGYAIGEVIESGADGLVPGDLVAGELGWQTHALMDARKVMPCPRHEPLSHLLSVLGIAGKTAYHGLIDVGAIAAGETLLVSAAAGSVGSLVGQIGKIKEARVVGIAGGPEKCRWIVEELGFDAAIDYKADNVAEAIARHCPKGVDVYFDNVGGDILEAALFSMNLHGRVVCCGAISQYDGVAPSGPRGVPGLIVMKRLRMEGFIVMDFAKQGARATADLAAWSGSGQLVVEEDIMDGLAQAPRALMGLLAGDNRGKRMVRIGPDTLAGQ